MTGGGDLVTAAPGSNPEKFM